MSWWPAGLAWALWALTLAAGRRLLVRSAAARYLAGVAFGIFLVWVSLAGFVLLLIPTGSLPSPRWRWWARVAVE